MPPDDRILALNFARPQYIPIHLGVLPSAWAKYRGQLRALADRFPLLFDHQADIPADYDEPQDPLFVEGDRADAWGCIWSNVKRGMGPIVTGHPVPTRADVHRLKPPVTDDGLPHGFMFLRLADLRGFEEVMLDFAEEPPELRMLIDVVLGHNLRQARLLLEKLDSRTPQIVYLGDDLGIQAALPISPEKWRRYLKPCFAAIFAPFRQAGHYIRLHTDGHVWEIIPDLIDCGVNVVSPQFRANGLDHLARACKGRICVDLDLDRQLFPFCTPADIDAHVRQGVEALGAPEGGLWLKAQVDDGVPLENIEALCVALMKYRGFFTNP